MPELPEVETTVRGLRPCSRDGGIARSTLRRADLRRPFPPDLRQRLTGAVVTGLGRRAKYGLIDTDRGDTLVFHLGMSGRWRIDPGEIGKHDHFVIETDEGRRLALNDHAPLRLARSRADRRSSTDLWPVRRDGPGAARRRVRRRLSGEGARRPDGADQGAAARPAHRRRPRQHLCLRGAQPRADRAGAGRRADRPRPGSTGSWTR